MEFDYHARQDRQRRSITSLHGADFFQALPPAFGRIALALLVALMRRIVARSTQLSLFGSERLQLFGGAAQATGECADHRVGIGTRGIGVDSLRHGFAPWWGLGRTIRYNGPSGRFVVRSSGRMRRQSAIVNSIDICHSLGMKTPELTVKKLIAMTPDMADAINEFRFREMIKTEAEAIRRLIERGLEASHRNSRT
jgi:hypothetical protein